MVEKRMIPRGPCSHLLLVLSAVSLLSGGCQWHLGYEHTQTLPGLRLKRLGNSSGYPEVSHLLLEQLRRQLIRSGGAGETEGDGPVWLEVTISEIRIMPVSSVQLDSGDLDQQDYVANLWRLVTGLSYRLTSADGKKVLGRGFVQGEAEFPDALDIATVRRDALEKSVAQACRHLMVELTKYRFAGAGETF
ncbi:MAG: hypothetical protein D6820_13885 [Lentisphaerae bacterium]|nr:MAG: hypothetical protein D6820_13885 [Lentisphaerota bacterium]